MVNTEKCRYLFKPVPWCFRGLALLSIGLLVFAVNVLQLTQYLFNSVLFLFLRQIIGVYIFYQITRWSDAISLLCIF